MTEQLSPEERKLARERVEQKIMLSSIPVSSTQIEESLGLSGPTVNTALRELNRKGRIIMIGRDGNSRLWEWRGESQAKARKTPGRLLKGKAVPLVPEPWSHVIARPSSTDHERYPSRMGDTLIYRDGRTEITSHAPQFPELQPKAKKK